MAASTDEVKRKYQDIRQEYQEKWLKKTYKGVPIHSDIYIFTILAEQFYLSPKTIENILFYRTNTN
ncbi:MAG: hypothetical protein COZ76_08560 [Flavobacteriales bacterium CG_4_8_14_3_um_filter_35_10]|nr:MAG: hypothetical protein COZ76_08560 [Flavobacteriales bacterium CG_4_8_14_3_um_filter_35_10]